MEQKHINHAFLNFIYSPLTRNHLHINLKFTPFLLYIVLQVSERTYEIEPENYTSEVDTSVASPRLLAKTSNSTTNFPTSQLEKENSHHTLYELVDLSKSRPSIRSLPNATKYSCNPLKPYHSVQFTQSQLSINESCLSTSRFKIHSHGNRIPIRISSLRRETKTAQTLSMVVGGFVICW